jgi:hypothetical protein
MNKLDKNVEVAKSLSSLYMAMSRYFEAEREAREDNKEIYMELARIEVKRIKELTGGKVIQMFEE